MSNPNMTFTYEDLFCSKLIGGMTEVRVGNYLRSYRWNLFYPPGSRGIADMIAIKNEWMIAIQCKSSVGNLNSGDTDDLMNFCKPLNAYPVFTNCINGKIGWHKLSGKTWEKIPYPKHGNPFKPSI